MGKIIGIDLGTTNSCVAVMEAGEPVVIPNAEGGRTIASVVAFSKTGERMVGQVAKRQAITNPDRTISSIKRDMGSNRKVAIDDKQYTPQEISAMVLQKIKQDAETHARVMRMRTYDYVDKMLYDMQEKMDELNMKYFGEMYTNLEQTFTAINETLAANREEMKNLAYKTQNEVESGTFAPGEEEE